MKLATNRRISCDILYKLAFLTLFTLCCARGGSPSRLFRLGESNRHFSDPRFRLPAQLTPCEQVLYNGDERERLEHFGRYPREIAEQFPGDTVKHRNPNRNLHCHCSSLQYMVCRIVVHPGSVEERIVKKRLDVKQDMQSYHGSLRPFFTETRVHDSIHYVFKPIYYENTDCSPKVVAEVLVKSSFEDGKVPRSRSSPANLNYVVRTIPRHFCKGGSCPILMAKFVHHDIVYVLQEDFDKLEEEEQVYCISAAGLNRIAAGRRDKKFMDPLRRTGNRLVTIEDDFAAFIITREDKPECNDSTSHSESSEADPSKAVPSEAGPSGTQPMSEPGPSGTQTISEPGPSRTQSSPSENQFLQPDPSDRFLRTSGFDETTQHIVSSQIFSTFKLSFQHILTCFFLFYIIYILYTKKTQFSHELKIEFLVP